MATSAGPSEASPFWRADDAGEYLALRRSTREAGFADREADAGLGASRMGKRLDRICCLLRIRLAAGDAALIDGHQCRRVVLQPTSPDRTKRRSLGRRR